MLLLTVIFMDILTGMEFDLFSPSLPSLQTFFGVTPFWLEAVLSVNFIGYCVGLFFVGNLADQYGRKPIIVSGILIFILGSALCLGIPAYPIFLLGRFLQGLGISAPAILSFLIVADRYPLEKQQFFLAMLNGSMNAAVAIAPIIGSYLTFYGNWQANFAALLALGILALWMTWKMIPYEKHSAVSNAIFSIQEYTKIFRSKNIVFLTFTMCTLFIPYWFFAGMSPLLYINALGVSLKHFGYYQGTLAFTFAIGSVIFGLVMKRIFYSQKTWLRLANCFSTISVVTMIGVMIFARTSPLLITCAMLIFEIGESIPGNILYPYCLSLMPEAKGKLSAVFAAGRLIFSSLVLQIAGYFYSGSFLTIGLMLVILIVLGIALIEVVNVKYSSSS